MKPLSLFRPLGPGSRLTLVGVLAVGAYSFASRQDSAASTFRLDANGVRQPATTTSQAPTTAARRWDPKPEPSAILNATKIGLNPTQRTALIELDRRWMTERSGFESRMKAAVQGVQAKGRVSLGELQAAGERVGELSRLYELRRAQAWTDALATLTAEQRKLLEATR